MSARDEDCAGCEREGHTCADCRTADEIEAEARETADVAALGFLLCPDNLRTGSPDVPRVAAAPCDHKVEDRIHGVAARGRPAPWTCGACLTDQPKAAPSAEVAGPYTRAQFAAAVDEAHSTLHELEDLPIGRSDAETIERAFRVSRLLSRAHEALHRVGAGLERVDCATADPEAQRLLADLLEAGQREIPCGHKVEDLIYGIAEIGRPAVTKCGACLAALPKREPVPARSFLPQGCSTKEIEAAAGVAARELVAEHGAPAGTIVEVRLVRRGGGATPCLTWQEPEHGGRCRACGGGRAEHIERQQAAQVGGA